MRRIDGNFQYNASLYQNKKNKILWHGTKWRQIHDSFYLRRKSVRFHSKFKIAREERRTSMIGQRLSLSHQRQNWFVVNQYPIILIDCHKPIETMLRFFSKFDHLRVEFPVKLIFVANVVEILSFPTGDKRNLIILSKGEKETLR